MKWKYVFNTNLKFTAGSDFTQVMLYVKSTGYKFFTFNGKVYFITGLTGEDTGIKTDELF